MQLSSAKTSRLLIAISLCMAVGGHWFVLQSVAWTGMLIRYAQEESMAVAVSKTFDGQNPCKLCSAIQEGQEEERKESRTNVTAKSDLILWPSVRLLAAPRPVLLRLLVNDRDAAALAVAPAVPPPRSRRVSAVS